VTSRWPFFRTRDTPNAIGLWRETFLGFASEFSGRRYYRFRPVLPRDSSRAGTRGDCRTPTHPEVFDRLYNDWSTLVKFQRTRGVLCLMAAVIHSLWEKGDHNPVILTLEHPRR
jgi:predicted AAA+ superfamily ATPase